MRTTTDEAHDAITGLPARSTRPAQLDGAGVLEAGDLGRPARRRGIAPHPLQQVGAVEAGGVHTYPDFLGTWLGQRHIAELDDLGTARTVVPHCTHLHRFTGDTLTILEGMGIAAMCRAANPSSRSCSMRLRPARFSQMLPVAVLLLTACSSDGESSAAARGARPRTRAGGDRLRLSAAPHGPGRRFPVVRGREGRV